ncbi:hypothetical protein KAR91_24775 [Candidatus Pacearchaeota archaeon]|nr:hypothetical protein [Candidatus Pacearchaeota archaeon]
MIDINTKLTVMFDDNSIFSDISDLAVDYTRDPFILTPVALQDYLYLGFYKPFNSTYIELETPNTIANTLTIEYYNGTTWVTADASDESRGLTRSGFIQWDKSSMESTTINSIAGYYVRIKVGVDNSAITFRGINLVFSDDNALKQEFFEIDDSNLLPSGENSHIMKHVASRNHIIQMLKNQGYVKYDSDSDEVNVNQWDLHEIMEIRQSSTMLALSKIFFNLSDSTEDMWWAKYIEYQNKFEAVFRLAKLTLDLNDDGVKDEIEKKAFKSMKWTR